MDKTSKIDKSSNQASFFDDVRGHICKILEFDYGFIDLARGTEITGFHSFAAEDDDRESKKLIETLSDENNQPLNAANSQLALRMRDTRAPYVGKATGPKPEGFEGAALADAPDVSESETESETVSFPYAIVPVVDGQAGEAAPVRGFIRAVCFDQNRVISPQDLATLKIMGEQISNRIPQFANQNQPDKAETENEAFEKQYVLVVHSNRLTRRRYSRILSSDFEIQECDSSEKAEEFMRDNRVDLLVLDSEIKSISGFALCKKFKESTTYRHIPIIMVTSDTQPEARVEGLSAGADDCVTESCLDSELFARVRSSLRHRKTERELAIQLQLLEDYAQRLEKATEDLSKDQQMQHKRHRELEMLRWESDILRSQDMLLHRISNTIRESFDINENLRNMLEALAGWFSLGSCFVVLPTETEPADSLRCEYFADEGYALQERNVDLSILDVFQKEFQTDQALIATDAANDKRLAPFRKDALPDFHFFSLFFVPISYEQKLLGILGGFKCESQANWNRDNDVFLKSVADQVAIGVTNARLYARVQRQATTDGLTGLYNHRTGQEKLAEQLKYAERYQRNVSVVMLDVDHFKSINDNYGHPAGDTVLKSVAKLVRRDVRDVDLPIRYGGEEFLLVLPEVNSESALVMAERIRKSLTQEIIRHEDITLSVTASFGIASYPEDATSQQSLLDLADKSLYLSKRLGRNQVHTAGDLMFEEISPQQKIEEKAAPTPPTSMPVPKYSDFVTTTVSPAAEQKEELVPEVVEMVKALATALYSKSEYNKQHHLETARLSELLAKVMGLSQQQVEQIRVAGLLHDVGTLSIPSDLLTKAGAYSESERQIINQHPVLGAQLLRPIRALRDICEILENHHERWDGTGYPRGLKGEEIPLPARIVSIVDSYHAMISDRPYRLAMTPEEAIQALKQGAGQQWDPFLVDIFIAVLASLQDGQKATQPVKPA